jgi:glutamyl-Q tRNA(Asp) synthetase
VKSVRTRFAPSPTGYLHLGHAFSALTAFDFAKAQGGQFVVRIEDIDHTRCRSHFEAAIYDDLAWLGLTWEQPVLRQSDHLGDYHAALDQLRDMGVLYADTRTRKGQAEAALSAPQEPPIVHADPAPPAWRLSLTAAKAHLGSAYDRLHFTDNGIMVKAIPETNGDVILGRKDIGVAYHLAVVMDDARQNISHIVRGHDLFDATHTQVLLQALLGLPTPQYIHHPLLLDEDGRRLAKRKGSKSLRDYRAEGLTPEAIREMIDTHPKQ